MNSVIVVIMKTCLAIKLFDGKSRKGCFYILKQVQVSNRKNTQLLENQPEIVSDAIQVWKSEH